METYGCGMFDTMENKLVLFEPGYYKFKMLIVTPQVTTKKITKEKQKHREDKKRESKCYTTKSSPTKTFYTF